MKSYGIIDNHNSEGLRWMMYNQDEDVRNIYRNMIARWFDVEKTEKIMNPRGIWYLIADYFTHE